MSEQIKNENLDDNPEAFDSLNLVALQEHFARLAVSTEVEVNTEES